MLSRNLLEEIRQKLQRGDQIIEENLHGLVQNMKQACESLDRAKCAQITDELLRWAEVKNGLSFCLERIASEVSDTRVTYVTGSLFLRDCLDILLKERRNKETESLLYVSGIELGGVIVLDKVFRPELDEQSGVYVSAEQTSSQAIFSELHDYGHGLYAWFHNHTASGESATFPSHKDFATQERLERGGYKAVGAIFSDDGLVRFFSKEMEFKVEVFGKGVTKIDEHIYRIEQAEKA